MPSLRSVLTWTTSVPVLALLTLVLLWPVKTPPAIALTIAAVLLAGAVLAAVQHAELVAHRVGEPFGSLVLAVAVTVIEVGLIVTLMVTGKGDTSTLARDTVFAAVMITVNGIVGLSLLRASMRHGTAVFNAEGAGAALATVAALTTLCLVLPVFTTARSAPEFSGSQLAFVAVASLVLYGIFVVTQTVRHRDFFLPVKTEATAAEEDADHADPPTRRAAVSSLVLLLVALVAVVGLAKIESPAIESAVKAAGFPQAVVGVVIALLVLLPESIAAYRAATRDRVQTSLNLGFGSAMASTALTIPSIALASLWLEGPLVLGLQPTQIVLVTLSFFLAALTVVPGRATRLQGSVHLVLFAAFVFLSMQP